MKNAINKIFWIFKGRQVLRYDQSHHQYMKKKSFNKYRKFNYILRRFIKSSIWNIQMLIIVEATKKETFFSQHACMRNVPKMAWCNASHTHTNQIEWRELISMKRNQMSRRKCIWNDNIWQIRRWKLCFTVI